MNNISVQPLNQSIEVSISCLKNNTSISFIPTENSQIYSELAKKYRDESAQYANNASQKATEVSNSVNNAINTINNHVNTLENGFINSVNSISDNLDNINSVNSNKTNIDTVASNISNITTLSNGITHISAISEHISEISTVSGSISNVAIISDSITNINTVAGNIDNVSTVASSNYMINLVAQDIPNIRTVSGSMAMVNNVGGSISNVNKVGNKIADVSTVSASIANIATISGNIANVNTVANNISTINNLYDYIDQSKGKESGSVATDTTILKDIINYSHSTFDSSKFTVVGSPTITNDGIASGFSTSNYLTIPSITLGTKTWCIELSITMTSVSTLQRIVESVANSTFLGISINNSKFVCSVGDGSNWYPNASSIAGDTVLQNGNTYNYKVIYDGSSVKTYVNNNLEASWTGTINIPNFVPKIGLGRAGANPVLGSIDLKQFSITVDGVPVFSGNKTGIDTIKPNNYTVTGTPTITDDGIASGFTSGNYIYSKESLNFANYNSWELDFSVVATSFSVTNYLIHINPTPTNDINSIGVTLSTSGNFWWTVGASNSSSAPSQLFNASSNLVAQLNTLYYIKFGFDGTEYYFKYSTDGINYIKDKYNTNSTKSTCTGYIVNGKKGTVTAPYVSIDLNDLRFYANGNLIYQPCLKIPYTESKTGSKVVDSYYRDRVTDMYNQFGYAPYYTLSDSDFTLPMGEVYGLMKKSGIDGIFPDYGNYISISADFTAPCNGYVCIGRQVPSASINNLSINNGTIGQFSTSLQNTTLYTFGGFIPISKGETFKSTSYSSSVISARFYPMKGV